VFFLLLIVVAILDIVIYIYEVPVENSINNVYDIIWWNVVTLTTVGYGDMYPTTYIGKVATVLIMLSGIATVAYLLSGIVEYVVDIHQKRELGLLRVKMEDHVVICNWNDRAYDLISQLNLHADIGEEIVVIDNALESRPLKTIQFVKGIPSDVETLVNANVEKAKKVIILAKGVDKSNADANTVLTALAVRSLNPNVFICAEILATHNAVFLKNAQVDEIIDINTIVSRFIAQTAFDPKLLKVLNELVSNEDETCEIYRVKLPDNYQNLQYKELFNMVKQSHDSMVIALEDSKIDKVIMNPQYEKIYTADYCFVISKEQPYFV
jgi:voltage-gated potassium channel